MDKLSKRQSTKIDLPILILENDRENQFSELYRLLLDLITHTAAEIIDKIFISLPRGYAEAKVLVKWHSHHNQYQKRDLCFSYTIFF